MLHRLQTSRIINDTRLIPSLTPTVCVLPSLIYFHFFLYVASHDDIQMEYLCKAGLATGTPIDPSRLPWSVYAYSLDGFVHERAMGRNINVMVYPFLDGTRAVSSLPFLALSFLFLFLHPSITYSNIVFYLKLAHYTRA